MTPKIGMIGGRILVLPTPPKTHEGAIALPTSARARATTGTVLATGPGPYDEREEPRAFTERVGSLERSTLVKSRRMQVRVGDLVSFTNYAGVDVEINGTKYLILNGETEVLAILAMRNENPEWLQYEEKGSNTGDEAASSVVAAAG